MSQHRGQAGVVSVPQVAQGSQPPYMPPSPGACACRPAIPIRRSRPEIPPPRELVPAIGVDRETSARTHSLARNVESGWRAMMAVCRAQNQISADGPDMIYRANLRSRTLCAYVAGKFVRNEGIRFRSFGALGLRLVEIKFQFIIILILSNCYNNLSLLSKGTHGAHLGLYNAMRRLNPALNHTSRIKRWRQLLNRFRETH